MDIKKHTVTEKDSEMVIKYLVWLKTLSELILRDTLSISSVDRLFSYKFFIAVNNKEIQNLFLEPMADTYRAIYIVHKMWYAYKKKNNLPIIKEETDLGKLKNYNEFTLKI